MSTVQEREEIISKWNQTIKDFREDWDRWEKQTLKDYLLKCAEIIELQIQYQVIDIKKEQISSYLFAQLIKEGIEVTDRWIREVLPDDYKRNYSKSELPSESSKWITVSDGDDLIQKDQFDNFKINGVDVIEKKQPKFESDETGLVHEAKEIPEDDYSKLLLVYSRCGGVIERLYDSLRQKYFEGRQEEIRAYYKDVPNLTQTALEILAKLQNSKSLLDDRNKWGDYEKIIMKFLIDTGVTTAHLADKVGYCSKYGSIGVDRNDDTDYINNEELKKFLQSCPSCKNDIAKTLNENLQLYHLGKEMNIITPI